MTNALEQLLDEGLLPMLGAFVVAKDTTKVTRGRTLVKSLGAIVTNDF